MANERVEKVTDIVKEGDIVKVKLTAIDERGRLNLSNDDVGSAHAATLERTVGTSRV